MPKDQAPSTTHTVKPVVLVGAGGHARVLLSLLKLQQRPVLALLDDDTSLHGKPLGQDTLTVSGGLEGITQYPPDSVELVNAIGSAHRPTTRQTVYEKYSKAGYAFATLIHPAAVIASEATIESGVQVMAGAVIQTNATLKANGLINTAASIDHDTIVGSHTHIAPGATICGGVTIGPCCHIGAGATVVQGVIIGRSVVVGAGATVLGNVPDEQIVAGTPARSIAAK
jgi:UDP-perosamine 4-acetyltransferase